MLIAYVPSYFSLMVEPRVVLGLAYRGLLIVYLWAEASRYCSQLFGSAKFLI